MGDYNRPQVTTYDSTPQSVNTLQNQALQYLQGFMQNPQGWQQQFQNPLAAQSQTNLAGMSGYNPEAQTHTLMNPLLMGMARTGGNAPVRPELQFQNNFRELIDPAGGMNPLGQAMSTLGAATPIFERNLQTANANLATVAPGRFSSALAQEGRDLNATAMQDFNLFANQAIQQALGLEQQNRESVRNFGLGARGLQQGAEQNTAQNMLGARNLAQQGDNDRARNQLGAMDLAGRMAAQAGNGAFNRELQAGTFGMQQQQLAMDGIMKMLAGIMGWAQPQPGTPIVGQSPLGTAADIASLGLNAYNAYKGPRQWPSDTEPLPGRR